MSKQSKKEQGEMTCQGSLRLLTVALNLGLLAATLAFMVENAHTQSIKMRGPAAVGLVPRDTIKPIEPPFGLNWGESEENIIRWVKENNYPSTKGKTKGENPREAIEVDGPFANAEYNRIRFYFGTRGLNEVELQFNELGPPNDKNQEFATFTKSLAIKNKIDSEYGKGILVKNEKGDKGGAQWQFIQQIWTDEEHSIWLAVFVASHKEAATLSMASLHYRWEEDIKPPKKK